MIGTSDTGDKNDYRPIVLETIKVKVLDGMIDRQLLLVKSSLVSIFCYAIPYGH